MAQHGGHCFEAHAPVDGLGSQGVAQPVRVKVSDPGPLGYPFEHAGHAVTVQQPALMGQQQPRSVVAVAVLPLALKFD
jgi:hypothetical protein